MTTTPDPKTVTAIAKAAMDYALRQCRDSAVEAALLASTSAPVLGREFDDLARATIAEYDRLGAVRTWPDEQPATKPDTRPLVERLAPADAERVAALIDERDCWRKEVLELRAKVAEQPAAGQDGDEAAGRVAAYLDRMEQLHSEDGRLPYVVVAEGIMRNDPTLMAADVRAVLADRNRLAARVAELAAELHELLITDGSVDLYGDTADGGADRG